MTLLSPIDPMKIRKVSLAIPVIENDVHLLSADKIAELSDVNLIRQQLALAVQEETKMDRELDLLLQNKSQIEKWLLKLDKVRPILIKSQSDAKDLTKTVSKTWNIAQGMSEMVRRLDLEQSRVKQCSQILDDIQELKVLTILM